MKRFLAACLIATALSGPALANVRTSAQPLQTSVANNSLAFDLFQSETVMGLEVTGVTAAGATLTIQGSTDGRPLNDPNKVWFATVGVPFTCPSPSATSTVNADGPYKVDVSGLTNVRVIVTATGTGNALVSLNAIPGAALGTCGGSGGGGTANVNIHDSAGGALTSTGGALNVAGTFTANLSGFTPTPSYAQLAASDTANHSVATPTGVDEVISNLDTGVAYCNFGAASTTSAFPIPGGVGYGFHFGGTASTIQCQSPTSSLKITISGGAGLWAGAGGGGGSGTNASVGAVAASAPGSATYNGMLVNGGNMVGASGSVWGSAPTALNVLGVNADVLSSVLPTGAATSANQEVTTAGTTATSAQAVQGVTGGVPFLVNPGTSTLWGVLAQGSSTTGELGRLGMAAVTTAAPAYTAGQTSPLSLDTAGNLRVNCVSGCSTGGGGSGGSTPQTTNGAPINISTATTTKIISLSSGKFTYLTAFNINTPSTGTVQLEYGTQTTNPCDTGTATITGQYSLATQGGIALGSGFGTALPPIPIGNDVCMITTGGSVNAQGAVSYTQSSTALSSFGGGGGGLSVTDNSSFTAGTSPMTPIGCWGTASPTNITSGDQGMVACSLARSLYIDVQTGSNFATLLGAGTFTITGGTGMPGQGIMTGVQDNVSGGPIPPPSDVCAGLKSYVEKRITTGSAVLVAGSSGKKIYICPGSKVMTDQDNNLSLVEGTTTTTPCDTGTADVYDNDPSSVSAANGTLYLRGGGIQLNGSAPAQTAVFANSLCEFNTTTNSPSVHVHLVYVLR